jgi:transposase
LQSIRQFQTTEDFKERYAKRAGIEGTISQASYALNMRRARYRGVVKTHLQHVLTSCAINLKRVVDWLNEKPRSTTRKSRFAALAA